MVGTPPGDGQLDADSKHASWLRVPVAGTAFTHREAANLGRRHRGRALMPPAQLSQQLQDKQRETEVSGTPPTGWCHRQRSPRLHVQAGVGAHENCGPGLCSPVALSQHSEGASTPSSLHPHRQLGSHRRAGAPSPGPAQPPLTSDSQAPARSHWVEEGHVGPSQGPGHSLPQVDVCFMN